MVAGNKGGRKRQALPTAEEALEELRRQRRQARRRERAERKRLEAAGLAPAEEAEADSGGDAITGVSSLPRDRVPTVDELKRDLMGAFHHLGGMAGLVAWGKRYPKEFYALWSKYCLPAASDGPSGEEDNGSLEAMLRQLDERERYNNTEH